MWLYLTLPLHSNDINGAIKLAAGLRLRLHSAYRRPRRAQPSGARARLQAAARQRAQLAYKWKQFSSSVIYNELYAFASTSLTHAPICFSLHILIPCADLSLASLGQGPREGGFPIALCGCNY